MTDAEDPFIQFFGPIEDPYPHLKAVLICVPCLLLTASATLLVIGLMMGHR